MATEYTTNYHLKKPDYTDDADVYDLNDNMDVLDETIKGIDDGKKSTQTPVTDPTASGNAVAFIDSISQDANGEITPSKKNVREMSGATSSGAGASGLVPAPAAGDQGKYLRGDGNWETPPNTTYSSKAAASGGTDVSLCTTGEKYNWNNSVKKTGNESIAGVKTFSDTTDSSSTSTGAVKLSGGLGVAKNIYGNKVWNGVWNDYAECREAETTEPGRCVRESISGVMKITDRRMMRGCKIISDTFGTCMGETDKAKTPIGVAGRVLAYPARNRNRFYLGAPVCSGPNGTVDVMSRLEAILHPECIIGTVSEVPTYEEWIAGTKENPKKIKVNGRIWIYVR